VEQGVTITKGDGSLSLLVTGSTCPEIRAELQLPAPEGRNEQPLGAHKHARAQKQTF